MGQFDDLMKGAEGKLKMALDIASGGQVDMVLAAAATAEKLGPEMMAKLGGLFSEGGLSRPNAMGTLEQDLGKSI